MNMTVNSQIVIICQHGKECSNDGNAYQSVTYLTDSEMAHLWDALNEVFDFHKDSMGAVTIIVRCPGL